MMKIIKGIESPLGGKTEEIKEKKYISSSKETGDKELDELQAHFESLLKEGKEDIGEYKEHQQKAFPYTQQGFVKQQGKDLQEGQQEVFLNSVLFTKLTSKSLKKEEATHIPSKDSFLYANLALSEQILEKAKEKGEKVSATVEVSVKQRGLVGQAMKAEGEVPLEGDKSLKGKVEITPNETQQELPSDLPLIAQMGKDFLKEGKQVFVKQQEKELEEGQQEEFLNSVLSEKAKEKGEKVSATVEVSVKQRGLVGQAMKAEGEVPLEGDKSLKGKVEITPNETQQELPSHTDLPSATQMPMGIKDLKEKKEKFKEEQQDVSLKFSSEDLAAAILKNYFPEVKGKEKVVSSAASSERTLVEVANEIAERIFVSEKKVDGSQEIRILLKDSVLPQTEVRVFKKEGVIHIAFQTSSQEAHRLLLDNRESLNNYLNQQLETEIRVEINFFSSQTEANTEGRSRGRRFVYEEIER
jgi:type III secretion system needle length determinant